MDLYGVMKVVCNIPSPLLGRSMMGTLSNVRHFKSKVINTSKIFSNINISQSVKYCCLHMYICIVNLQFYHLADAFIQARYKSATGMKVKGLAQRHCSDTLKQ